MDKFSIVSIILVISIIITIGSVESVAADKVKFDQKFVIINGQTDIISLIDDTAPFETGSTVIVKLSSPTGGNKNFTLYKVTGTQGTTQIFRTIVNFTTAITGIENIFRVGLNEQATLSFGQLPTAQVTMKPKSDVTPNPAYMNNKFTTNAVICTGVADSDGDGICNTWEQNGLNVNNVPGITGSYSPSGGIMMERGPPLSNQKDIYLEIDYMQGYRPNEEAIWDVIDGFKNNMGINLHVQLDDEDTSATSTLIPYNTCTKWPGSNVPASSKGFDQIAATYFGTLAERGTPRTTWDNSGWILKHQVFHHALFVHKQCGSTSSGVAEIGGDEFMVTLGVLHDISETVSPDQIAGTLMHELGHNLNLNHGGGFSDVINCKPTHLSVMNYARQWSDLVSDRKLEYSRQAVNGTTPKIIKESSLKEQDDIELYAPDPTARIVWGPTPPLILPTTGVTSVDWNKNGISTDTLTNFNINSISTNNKVVCQENTIQDLAGFWDTDPNTLVFNIRSDGDWQDGRSVGTGPIIESPFCLTASKILNSIPVGISPQAAKDIFNRSRSCAGGQGETDPTIISTAYQNATISNGTLTNAELAILVTDVTNQSSVELTPDDAITMRLSRIDSISDYLKTKFPSKPNTIEPNIVWLHYAPKLDNIKKDIMDHKLLYVLKELKDLYYDYPTSISDPKISSELQKGTSDVYDSINKAVLGPPMSKESSHPPIGYDGIISPEYIDDFETSYPGENPFMKNGQWVITEWKIVKGEKTDVEEYTYLKPLKMLKFVDKNELVCNKPLVPLEKPDGKSVICVKDSTKKKLESIWHSSKTTMNQN